MDAGFFGKGVGLNGRSPAREPICFLDSPEIDPEPRKRERPESRTSEPTLRELAVVFFVVGNGATTRTMEWMAVALNRVLLLVGSMVHGYDSTFAVGPLSSPLRQESVS